jgi:hypothetical protein
MKVWQRFVTPGELDHAKQDWRRDPTTWRERFRARFNWPGANVDEIATSLEAYFEGLPTPKPRLNRQGHRY